MNKQNATKLQSNSSFAKQSPDAIMCLNQDRKVYPLYPDMVRSSGHISNVQSNSGTANRGIMKTIDPINTGIDVVLAYSSMSFVLNFFL